MYYLKFALGIGNPISVGGMEVSTDEPLKFVAMLRQLARLLNMQADVIEHGMPQMGDDGVITAVERYEIIELS